MKLLKEIFHDQGLNLEGRNLAREAVKGIIRQGSKLLMIHCANGGGYKFPGGGVDAGEADEQTLAREIREECGARLLQVDGEFGQVVEYKRPFELEQDVFKMISRYYLCQVEDGVGELRMDTYEQELGFRPVWVDIDDALGTNRKLLRSRHADVPTWINRETFILEQVGQQLIKNGGVTNGYLEAIYRD